MSSDERRRAQRHYVCVPARVQPEDGNQKLALIENISVSGAALLTRSEPEVGESIHLALYFSGTGAEPRWTWGSVVRVTPVDYAIWKCRVAVAFEKPLDDCAAEILALAEDEEPQ